MCGIVGYIGTQPAAPILVAGLQSLEYRGYDSAGIALLDQNQQLDIYKTKGKVADLSALLNGKTLEATLGMGHTRWATHGVPSEQNAHPHLSMSGRLALVHNGIIENYAVLKEQLQAEGYVFQSMTDTEVLVNFIEHIQIQYKTDTLSAMRIALRNVIGAYAIALIDKEDPTTLYAARKSSPLAIGVGEENHEFFLASDATPIVMHTKHIIYLNDEEIAVLKRDTPVQIIDLENKEICPDIKEVEIDLGKLSKGGYDHFMLKEIFDQPECMRDCMRGRLLVDTNRIVLNAVETYRDKICAAQRIIILACGTSWHAGLIGKYLFEQYAGVSVDVEYASEFRYRQSVVTNRDIVIAISQSGETADTLAAIECARQRSAMVFGIVNAVGSSIARATDTGTYIHVGPEIGVASTKAFTGQVTVLTLLALAIAQSKQTLSEAEYQNILVELSKIPSKMEKLLETCDPVLSDMSRCFTYARNFLFLGRGYNYPVALEGALKLKEISYIHAEGYPAAEMKHGPIALIDQEMPVIVIAPHDSLYEKVVSNIQEIKARKGTIIAVVTEGDETIANMADFVIEIPETLECLSPLLTVVPLQLFSYYVAISKGKNVDQPRNLAKSVTVE
jgi:glucosamine--fructose-6-phosphate aminotransferase (isomerizing)